MVSPSDMPAAAASDNPASRKLPDFSEGGRYADDLAAGLLEPVRQAETLRHCTVLFDAMNGSVDDNGEQDLLAVTEAVAMLLGLIVGNLPAESRPGQLFFVLYRALHHAERAEAEGTAGPVFLEPDDHGQGGHA